MEIHTYKPFEVLKANLPQFKKCNHEWKKVEHGYVCLLCEATGFMDKEKNKIFMKKNKSNFQKSNILIK